MSGRRRAGWIAAILIPAAAFGAVTLAALEGQEVVVLRTRAADGGERTTRAWIADADGAAWVEAANPERPFLHDLARAPDVVLERRARPRRCRARVAANPEGHDRIRRLLAAKYGWADRWVALFADTGRSVAVRLDCTADGAPPADGAALRPGRDGTRTG
ncbi:MAG: hypothetical protein IT294_06860 [Deltaproteobacteria bacterium]|nr:hypothetical protein [Deltaproteobacteria bacterium]